MRPLKLSSIIFVWIFCLVGCTLGPDFETPAPPETKSYTESKLPEKTVETKGSGGQAQYFIEGKDLYSKDSTSLNRSSQNARHRFLNFPLLRPKK